MTTNLFHNFLLLLFLDPGSEIRNPGWVQIRIRIRDKHCLQINLLPKRHFYLCNAVSVKEKPNEQYGS
jgi:hypothetical protein